MRKSTVFVLTAHKGTKGFRCKLSTLSAVKALGQALVRQGYTLISIDQK